MMFGAPAAAPVAPKSPKLTESTVRLGPQELDRMMREHEASRTGATTLPPDSTLPPGGSQPAPANRTMMFGAPAAAVNPAPSVPKSTQMFGAVPTPAPVPKSTQMFGAVQTPAPMQPKSTQMFGQVSDAAPAMLSPMPLSSSLSGGSVELPPEPLMSPTHVPMASQIDDGSGEELAAMLRAQQQKRNRIALIVIAVVLLGALGAVGAKLLGSSLSNSTPPELLQAAEAGLATLRLDDSDSKQKAVTAFTELATKHPDFIEAHAGLVTALALQFDDVQQRFARLARAFDDRNNRVARYNKERSPSDWQNKAAVLEAEAKQIKEEHDPLVAQAKQIDAKVRTAYTALGDAATRAGAMAQATELAFIRAQAIYHAVYKTDQAIPLIQRYDNLAKGKTDGWIDLALAEYAVNAVSSTESKTEALTKLNALTSRDSTFLRAYVLSGRVNLALKRYGEAETDFEKVMTMRKDHDVASELSKWAHKLKREADGANAAP
jgi:tetratricopeptide (TPR) repeat protein